MTDKRKVDIRELALNGLMEVLEKGRLLSRVTGDILDNYRYLEKTDRAFFSRLLEGTVERAVEIDYIINGFSKVPVKKMKPVIRNILREAVYQIRFMDRIPDSAACNQAVMLAGKRGFQNLKGFVNGILRNISRNPALPSLPAPEEDWEMSLSLRCSLPLWLVRLWKEEYGIKAAESMGRAALLDRETTIRCNRMRTDPAALKALLESRDIRSETGRYVPHALRLLGYDSVERLPGFKEGLFFVQDESSMLAVEAAGIKEGDYVIDVCAAPGGKALYAAQKLRGTGFISARDISEAKTAFIRENKEREGVSNLEVRIQDACVLREEDREQADIVIADLPCSGLGMIGKKPDIKYKASPESIKELAALQRKILSVVREYVKPGGTLLYSTCTVTQEENNKNRDWFLGQFKEFEAKDISPYMPTTLRGEATGEGYLQLLPGIHGTDGFFFAAFRKQKQAED